MASPRSHRRSGRPGFSLLELLVVVAVLGTLFAILVPAIADAQRVARTAACASNMRQIMVATLGYATDRGGHLPGASGYEDSGMESDADLHASWFYGLAPYMDFDRDIERIARCPDDESPSWDAPNEVTGSLRRTSYGTNAYLSGLLPGYQRFSRLHALRRPTLTVFAGELSENGGYATSDHFHPELWLIDPAGQASLQLAQRHHGASNWSFLDGHVARHDVESLYALDPESSIGDIRWLANRFDPTVAR